MMLSQMEIEFVSQVSVPLRGNVNNDYIGPVNGVTVDVRFPSPYGEM